MSWLDEVRERAEKATPGPWSVEKFYHEEQEYQKFIKSAAVVYDNGTSSGVITRNDWSNPVETDLDFIAHAREDVPKLIAYIDKLHEAVDYFAVNKCPPNGDCIPVEVDCSKCVKRYLNELAEEAINDGRVQTHGA